MRLVVGLGNPGKKYQLSRHNFGFLVIEHLARIHKVRFFLPRFKGRTARISIDGERIMLLKPWTYMNLSGQSVALAVRALKINPEQLIVIHDDLDLELGQIKLGFSLSSAGHKGLESIIEHLGTKDFYRVRLGIGKPKDKEEVVEYVLDRFSEEEMIKLEEVVKQAGHAVEVLVKQGLGQAQNLFHKRS